MPNLALKPYFGIPAVRFFPLKLRRVQVLTELALHVPINQTITTLDIAHLSFLNKWEQNTLV